MITELLNNRYLLDEMELFVAVVLIIFKSYFITRKAKV